MKTAGQRYLFGLACVAIVAGLAFFVPAWTGDQPRRPQTPSAPLPYEVRQVAFDNAKAAVRLAGTLTLPRAPGRHPVIVLIPGQGEVDRDGTLFGHQFYLVLADDLTRRGFAVLRSDKRGLGGSGGKFSTATSLDFASDIEAGLAFLRSRPDIDTSRIGLIGHSEGGLIGTIVAGRDSGIAFLVLMAANGIPASEMILAQKRRQPPPSGDRHGVEKELAMTPWMRTLLTLDPESLLRRLRCPVLAMVGEKDRVVTADENVPALERGLAGNPKAQVHRLPALNHFFQTADSGEFSEVAGIEETISPRALELVGTWAMRQPARPSYLGSPNTWVQ